MGRNLWVIIKKELKRVFTDKRIIFTAFILPALSITLIYSIMGLTLGNMVENRQTHKYDMFVKNPPNRFIEISSSDKYIDKVSITKVSYDKNTKEIKKKVKNGEIDLFIDFPKDFKEKISNYKNIDKPNIETFYNSAEEYSSEGRFRIFKDIMEDYERDIIGKRLGNIEYTTAFKIDEGKMVNDLAQEKEVTGKGLSFLLPMLISIFLFAGGIGIGTDSIAGEKERGTMATLLVTPVERETIAFGKLISLGIVSIISAFSAFVGVVLSFPFSKEMFGGSTASLDISTLGYGISEILKLLIIMITLVGIYVGLISLISIISKTVKEAGTYSAPIYMVVMVASFMNMFNTGQAKLWEYFIPIYGSVVAMKNLFTFQLTWIHVFITALISILTTIILIYFIKKMFNSEKVMFNQ
mgnify:CR=1 FL=1